MSKILKAVYHDGAFVPKEPCDVPENAEVELIIQGPYLIPPQVTETEQREQILRTLLERMKQNPIPAGAPIPTRDQLHERR
jgi:predicted DNA-binding antitoxin AbrB/MazE fold protein